jgi:hypothetical protein
MLAGNLEQNPKPQKAFLSSYNLQMLLQALQRDLDDSQQRIFLFRALLSEEPYEGGQQACQEG